MSAARHQVSGRAHRIASPLGSRHQPPTTDDSDRICYTTTNPNLCLRENWNRVGGRTAAARDQPPPGAFKPRVPGRRRAGGPARPRLPVPGPRGASPPCTPSCQGPPRTHRRRSPSLRSHRSPSPPASARARTQRAGHPRRRTPRRAARPSFQTRPALLLAGPRVPARLAPLAGPGREFERGRLIGGARAPGPPPPSRGCVQEPGRLRRGWLRSPSRPDGSSLLGPAVEGTHLAGVQRAVPSSDAGGRATGSPSALRGPRHGRDMLRPVRHGPPASLTRSSPKRGLLSPRFPCSPPVSCPAAPLPQCPVLLLPSPFGHLAFAGHGWCNAGVCV